VEDGMDRKVRDRSEDEPFLPKTQTESAGGGRPPRKTAVAAGAGEPDDGDGEGGGVATRKTRGQLRRIFEHCVHAVQDALEAAIKGRQKPLPGFYHLLQPHLRALLSSAVIDSLRRASGQQQILHSTHFGTEHLLLGMLTEQRALASGVLMSSGVHTSQLQAKARNCEIEDPDNTEPSPACADCFEKAFNLSRGGRITTAHVLLALLDGSHNNALHIISQCGIDVPATIAKAQHLVDEGVPEP
jgi:ATP-dependent Clp protease ATP-binding subunit ClpA